MNTENNDSEKQINDLENQEITNNQDQIKGGFGIIDGKVDFVNLTDPTGTQIKVGELMDPIVTSFIPTPIQDLDVNMDLEDQTLDS